MSEPTAEWRIHPITERDTIRDRRQRTRRRTFQVLVFPVFLGVPFAVLGGMVGAISSLLSGLIVLSVVLLGLVAFGFSSNALEASLQNDRARQAEYSGVEGHAVALTIFQGATPTGYDHGVLWSEDGRLFFVGSRTSFGLYGSSVVPGTRRELALHGSEEPSLTLTLTHETTAGPVSLDFRPWPASSAGNAAQSVAGLGWLVRSWLLQDSRGEGQLPPLSLGPDVPTPRLLLARALVTTLLWCVAPPVVLLLLVATVSTWAVLSILLLLVIVWPLRWAYRAFGTPADGWLSWRDRRRLEKAQWKT